DVIQITPSFGLFTGGFGFHYGAERIGAMVIPTGAGRTSLQLRLMQDLKATVVTAIATYPLRLVEVAREEQFDLASLSLRVGIFGSETWSDELRLRIERELAIQSFDIIGMTETGGPGMGIDCGARAGIHVWEDHYHPEIVDPATGAVVPDGTEGELVVSTLTRVGLPLVRYRTHDLTRVLSRARCGCGRTALRLDRPRGRTDASSGDARPRGRHGPLARAGDGPAVPHLSARMRRRARDPRRERREPGPEPIRRP